MSPVRKASVGRVLLLAIFVSLPVAGALLTLLEVLQGGIGVDGLDRAQAVAASSDGRHIYVAGHERNAIAIFRRPTAGGSLVYAAEVKDDGMSVFLDGPTALAVSPDGRQLFATTDVDDSLVVFSRDATTNDLVQVAVFQDGIGPVDGIAGAQDLTVSPDGRHVYVAGADDFALAVFARNARTGTLRFAGLEADGVGGVDGLAGASAVAVSPDGELVVVAGTAEDSLAVFARDAKVDDLTFVASLVDGVDGVRNLRRPVDVVFSEDGQNVYAATDDRITLFQRHGSTLEQVASVAAFEGVSSLRVFGDDQLLLASSDLVATLSVYQRDPADGTLTLAETFVDGVDGLAGLAAFGPGDLVVYTGAVGDQAAEASPVVFAASGTNDSFVIRDKPDIAGADGVSTTSSNFPSFFGTSASAPHAAAIAALMIEATAGLQSEALAAAGIPLINLVTQARGLFKASSLDIESAGFDRDSGSGILDANAALQKRIIFSDGFESGDTSIWTSEQP